MTAPASADQPAAGPSRAATFGHALFFVAGFSLIFIIGWGGAATLLGQLSGQYKTALGRAGGALVVVFGLYTLGVLRIPWLGADTRPHMRAWRANRPAGSSEEFFKGTQTWALPQVIAYTPRGSPPFQLISGKRH